VDGAQTSKPRVVVAENNMEMLRLIVRILGAKAHLLGTAQTGKEAVTLVLELQPDILILDAMLPVLDGMEVAAVLQRYKAQTKLIFLTSFDDPEFVQRALHANGRGFVSKSHIHGHLLRAIWVVMDGWTFLSSEEPN
jgi:YesN/AraC family two-component response regulator